MNSSYRRGSEGECHSGHSGLTLRKAPPPPPPPSSKFEFVVVGVEAALVAPLCSTVCCRQKSDSARSLLPPFRRSCGRHRAPPQKNKTGGLTHFCHGKHQLGRTRLYAELGGFTELSNFFPLQSTFHFRRSILFIHSVVSLIFHPLCSWQDSTISIHNHLDSPICSFM